MCMTIFVAFGCYITRHWIAYTTIDIDDFSWHNDATTEPMKGHAEKISRADEL